MNSRNAAVRTAKHGRMRNDVRMMPGDADAEVGGGARDRAPGGRDDPVRAREQDGPDDDAGRVQDRGEGVRQEPPVGDEHLAEGRSRPANMTWAKQLIRRSWTYRSCVAGSSLRADRRPRATARRRRGWPSAIAASPRRRRSGRSARTRWRPPRRRGSGGSEDRDEGRAQPGRHEHVEGDLGDAERGVVGVELGARRRTCWRRPGSGRCRPRSSRGAGPTAGSRRGGRTARTSASSAHATGPVRGRSGGGHQPMMTDEATAARRHDSAGRRPSEQRDHGATAPAPGGRGVPAVRHRARSGSTSSSGWPDAGPLALAQVLVGAPDAARGRARPARDACAGPGPSASSSSRSWS